MKSTKAATLLLTILSLLIVVPPVIAKYILTDRKQPPKMPLITAYGMALRVLGSQTNRFYCLSAEGEGITHFDTREWRFGFSSTNGEQRYVIIADDGRSAVQEGGRSYFH